MCICLFYPLYCTSNFSLALAEDKDLSSVLPMHVEAPRFDLALYCSMFDHTIMSLTACRLVLVIFRFSHLALQLRSRAPRRRGSAVHLSDALGDTSLRSRGVLHRRRQLALVARRAGEPEVCARRGELEAECGGGREEGCVDYASRARLCLRLMRFFSALPPISDQFRILKTSLCQYHRTLPVFPVCNDSQHRQFEVCTHCGELDAECGGGGKFYEGIPCLLKEFCFIDRRLFSISNSNRFLDHNAGNLSFWGR